MNGANEASYKEMLRVAKFVMDTEHLGLRVQPDTSDLTNWKLMMYSDSDWAGDKQTRRSITGFILFLMGVPVL